MKTLKFKCTLMTDVILNVKSASEGANKTLDFIPGSCFLGIVASKLYKETSPEDAMKIFHSGAVRFGDAHPGIENYQGMENQRSLRIPASFYFPKGDNITDRCYVHHFIKDAEEITASNGSKAQLKQCRSGFYVMSETEGTEVKTDKTFAIKSAYDRNERRSKDAAMYGYESLRKGLELLFSVEVEDDTLAETIESALVGERRVGRSRTAQYGLVEISKENYEDVASYQASDDTVVVYADSRLIFLDENNQPTFQPTVQQLLGPEAQGDIDWENSQIRTFQYAPWNYKRQCYDTDRCGIEKGSVLVVKNCKNANISSRYVGSYNNEGFGKVIFNPVFLQAEEGENGLAKCKLQDAKKKEEPNDSQSEKYTSNSSLFKYLEAQKKKTDETKSTYNTVNAFVRKYEDLFCKEKFASQWGTIRSIALQEKDNAEIKEKVKKYIGHGVKKEDWEGARAKALTDFMETNQSTLWESIINLASEMAKKCSR